MSKSSAMVPASSQAQYDSDHAASMDLKHRLEIAGTASLVSMQNLRITGTPGVGKTSILHFMARQVFGQYEEGGHYKKIECTPTLLPKYIMGHENPLFMLTAPDERNGMPYWIFDGTPRDPNVWHVILNELPRIGDIARDTLLPAMDIDLNVFHLVTFWADGNSAMSAQSASALNDRFALNLWEVDPLTDAHGIMRHGKPRFWGYDIPDVKTIETVRGWLLNWASVNPNTLDINGFDTQAYAVIQAAIDTLMEVLPGTTFQTNPRRIWQWVDVLYAMGALHAGKPDFKDLPLGAFEALASCYPTESQTDELRWKAIVMKSVDPLATKIAEFEANAMAHWTEEWQTIKNVRNGQERQQLLQQKIGVLLSKYQKTLAQDYGNDPRAKAAVNRLTKVYNEMFKGTFNG